MSERTWDPRVVVARRELSALSREKTILLALLIQLFVAAFSSFLVVGLTSLYDPGSVQAGEVEVGITGDAREELRAATAEHDGLAAIEYRNESAALAEFRAGSVDAVLAGSYDEPPDRTGRTIDVSATVPDGSIRTTLIVVQVREVLKTLERQERFERRGDLENDPLALPPDANASPYYAFTYTVLLPLLLFLPPFISGSIVVDSITEELERGTLELLRVTPASLVDVVDGKALAMTALAPAQAALWLLLLGFNGIGVANPLVLLAYVTAVAGTVVVFGVALAFHLERRRPAQLLYSVLTLVAFGAAVGLPEHPATTAAKLAIDSATVWTYAHVIGYLLLAVGLYALARRYVGAVDLESA